jgi:hypothetical protein
VEQAIMLIINPFCVHRISMWLLCISAARSTRRCVETSEIGSSFMQKTEIALKISVMTFYVGMKLLTFSWQWASRWRIVGCGVVRLIILAPVSEEYTFSSGRYKIITKSIYIRHKNMYDLYIPALYRWYHQQVFSVANVLPSKWPLAK